MAEKSARPPLSAWTWLRRNPRRVLPIFGIQMLVTALMVAIVTSTNAFEATYDAYIKPLETFTIVAPRHLASFEDELGPILDSNPAQLERLPGKSLWMRTPMLVGEGRAPLMAVPRDAQERFLERLGSKLVDGQLPAPDTDGAAVHEAILQARGMKIGDVFGQNVNPDDAVLGRFTVVGVLDGRSRLGLVDFAYADRATSVFARLPPFAIVYAADGRKAESDTWLRRARTADDRLAFRVVDERWMRERTEKAMQNLPVLIGFITGCVAVVVAIVTSLLNVIEFQLRVEEFGLYLAVGHRRGPLVRKLAVEAGIVAGLAWAVGVGVGILAVALFKAWWLAPRGIQVWVIDPRPIAYSLSVPFLSAAVSALALGRRLRQMDPVTILQRRGG